MLVTLSNNKLLSIIWRYDDVETMKRGYAGQLVKRTKCIVKDGIGKEVPVLTEGIAIQSPEDLDCKNCARRFSLSRAIKTLNLPKEDRTRFWVAYRAMRNGKW